MENSPFCCLCRALCIPSSERLSKSQKNRLKWKGLNINPKDQDLPAVFAVLKDLYDGNDVSDGLESCRINPDFTSNKKIRDDLEFYIPQLTNFMVFHEDFAKEKLYEFLEEWSKADPYFAHLYYWYINSLAPEIDQNKSQAVISKILDEGSEEKFHQLNSAYENFDQVLQTMLGPAEYETKKERRRAVEELVQRYKNRVGDPEDKKFALRGSDIKLAVYISPFLNDNESTFFSNSFTSTILFFEDLCFLSNEIIKEKERVEALKRMLKLINSSLIPSYAYVPFFKDSIRHYNILNIVVDETKVFSTKERAPYYICLELFMPHEELSYEYEEYFQTPTDNGEKKKKNKKGLFAKNNNKAKTENQIPLIQNPNVQNSLGKHFRVGSLNEIVSIPMTLKTTRGSHQNSPQSKMHKSLFSPDITSHENITDVPHYEESKEVEKQALLISVTSSPHKELGSEKIPTEEMDELAIRQHKTSSSDLHFKRHERRKSSLTNHRMMHRRSPLSDAFLNKTNDEDSPEEEKVMELSEEDSEVSKQSNAIKIDDIMAGDEDDFFGEDSEAQAARIRKASPFGTLKTWKLVHLIIKSGADMKEEQFAIQLIAKFEDIFRLENLKLFLSPYEILSLGEDVGVVEVLKDAITFSKVKEKMRAQNIPSLNAFFEKFYGKDVENARKRFCCSLAAYSLVCYFLQIKDRHNGNIMLHKKGHIVHIDFGFLLSNSPGKGLEFERKIPFKLLNEYVEVMGGLRSKLFQKFRKYFYKGFLAARKHKEQILILVKMIYSTHSQSFPCFKAGAKTLTDLEQRFNPSGVHENDLKNYCYNLINQSLDHWRAKCYDQYQYYFQGILY